MSKKPKNYVITYSELYEEKVRTKDINAYIRRLKPHYVYKIIDLSGRFKKVIK